jgi:hypothetical protein
MAARNTQRSSMLRQLPGTVVRIVSVGELFLNSAIPAMDKHLGRLGLFCQRSGSSHRLLLGAMRAERLRASLQLDQPEVPPGNHMIFLPFHHPMISELRTPSLQCSSGENIDRTGDRHVTRILKKLNKGGDCRNLTCMPLA